MSKSPNPQKNKKNFFLFTLITTLILILLSIILTVNWVNSSGRSAKFLSEFQKDIEDAVAAGPGSFPKINRIFYELNTGLFAVERLFVLDGHILSENYNVSAGSELLYNILNQSLPNRPNLTYFQAIFSPNGPALSEKFQYGFTVVPRTFFQVIGDNLFSILSLTVSIFLLFFLIRSFGKRFDGGSSFFLRRDSAYQRVNSKTKFSDIAGNVEAKEEVKELIDYLKYPKRFSSAGARIPKGILLGGPPGTGKTLIAKAIAGEAEVPFFFMSASSFIEVFVGTGARRVRSLFQAARRDSPAIVFIDELDAVGRSRKDFNIHGGDSEREQTLNQLLVEMDGIVENSGILVIGATNRSDVLDQALIRPGRFDRLIKIALPDVKEREEILRLHARGKRFDEGVTFERIAKRTPGFSGAQLENVINEASLLSVREGSKKIQMEQIDEAIDRVLSGPARKSRTISEAENIRVAYHEAGHAVVGLKTEGANKVQKITIIPRGDAGGYNIMAPDEERFFPTQKEMFATLCAFMGGRAAEEQMFGVEGISSGCLNDFQQATAMARKMVTAFGMSEKVGPIYLDGSTNPWFGERNFSEKTAQEIDKEIKRLLEEALLRAKTVISQNLNLLELIKDTLIEKETIMSEEIEILAKTLKPLEKSSETKTQKEAENITNILEEIVKEK